MTERSALHVPKWPFILGDLLFIALAAWIVSRTGQLTHFLQAMPLVLCVGAGAWLLITPFMWEHRAALKLAESENLVSAVQQVQNIESVAAQIATATGHWQSALDQSAKTVSAANEIAERMSQEARLFAEFMQKANDSEKAHLRLEVEKLRRSEAEWLQVVVRMLDHTFGLHQAGVRSGQPNIIQQLGGFQNAVRDAARRLGVVPVAPAENEAYDAARHQLIEEQGEVPAGAVIGEVFAPGYSFQGQLVRRAVVKLQPPPAPAPDPEPVVAKLVVADAQPETPTEQQLL